MNNENFPDTFQKMAGQETKTSIPVALKIKDLKMNDL